MQIRYDIFLTIGALFNDLYCATPNEVEAICIITELEDHRILFIGLQRGRSNRLVKFLCGELGAPMALECPEDIDSIDEAHLTEKFALVQPDVPGRIGLKREFDITFDERKKRRFELAFLENHLALAECVPGRQQGKFAQL